jgi:hypothetical protein
VLAIRRCLRSLAALTLTLPLAALAATPITGTVTNLTTNKPSAGDTVTLIRLAQGMQESTTATTDARGHYTLQVPDDGLHLVRVTHDKANYFKPAPAGTTTVDIDVYNAAAHVAGVTTEAAVLRLQTDPGGNSLKVVENFFVKNDSSPPLTQFSNQPFDFYLPDGAVVEGSAALAPGGMPVQATPVPLAEKGHYTFLFPIRPGETRFQVSYHVPYSGRLELDPKITGPTDTVAIMLPKAMSFTPRTGSAYSPVSDEVNAQTFVARNVTAGAPLSFVLTGSGQMPRDTTDAAGADQPSGDQGGQPVAATDNTAPGKGLDNPLDPEGNREPLSKYKWWILGSLALLLVAAAGVMLRKPSGAPGSTTAPQSAISPLLVSPQAQNTQLLSALKEEIFALETDKLQGKLTEAEYTQTKAALELILVRALQRNASPELSS